LLSHLLQVDFAPHMTFIIELPAELAHHMLPDFGIGLLLNPFGRARDQVQLNAR
jgi:hypothetical protein